MNTMHDGLSPQGMLTTLPGAGVRHRPNRDFILPESAAVSRIVSETLSVRGFTRNLANDISQQLFITCILPRCVVGSLNRPPYTQLPFVNAGLCRLGAQWSITKRKREEGL